MKQTAPNFLGRVGKSKWKSLVEQLGIIQPGEIDSLALLCASWEDFLAARDAITDQGRYLKSDVNGRTFINPAVNERNEAWKQIIKLSKSFGLHPEPRNLEAAEDDGKWADILEDKGN